MYILSKNIFTKLILSILISLVSVILILSITDKYKVSQIEKERSSSISFNYYYDLDNDGNSEKLHFQQNSLGEVGLLVYSNENIINHWRFDGDRGSLNSPFIEDFNNDGTKDVFLFSQIKDSLFIHCVDPINNIIIFKNKFVTRVYSVNERYNYVIYPGMIYDVDKDGICEIYFSITCGYATKPRNVYSYNYKKDIVIVSPNSCAPLHSLISYDLDKDSIPEFLSSTNAFGNCGLDRNYSDQYSWIMVFNPDLSFKFKPIAFKAYPSETKLGILSASENYIFVFHFYRGTGEYPSFMALLNSEGQITKINYFEKDTKIHSCELINDKKNYSYIYLVNEIGDVFKIDTNLNLEKHSSLPEISFPSQIQRLDIDKDGEDEFISPGQNSNQLVITRHDFKHSTSISLIDNIVNPVFSLKETNYALPELVMDTNEYSYCFSYKKSLAYKYWYFLLIINSLFVYFILYFIARVKEYRELKIKDTQKKISELQLKSFQNQIDPHFTFNIIETFGNLITEDNKEKATFIFNNYTKILKSVIINSDKVFITLNEELEFVKSYLDLEVYRNNSKFNYQIHIQPEANTNIIIPKMLIHIFVENAIKHGVKHLDSGGNINIECHQKNASFNIHVEDNGIGREKAKELSGFSTGKGIKIIDEILKLYFKLYRVNISHKIIDLKENDMPSGTLVVIKIPTKRM